MYFWKEDETVGVSWGNVPSGVTQTRQGMVTCKSKNRQNKMFVTMSVIRTCFIRRCRSLEQRDHSAGHFLMDLPLTIQFLMYINIKTIHDG